MLIGCKIDSSGRGETNLHTPKLTHTPPNGELTDAGDPARSDWRLMWPARVRSSYSVRRPL